MALKWLLHRLVLLIFPWIYSNKNFTISTWPNSIVKDPNNIHVSILTGQFSVFIYLISGIKHSFTCLHFEKLFSPIFWDIWLSASQPLNVEVPEDLTLRTLIYLNSLSCCSHTKSCTHLCLTVFPHILLTPLSKQLPSFFWTTEIIHIWILSIFSQYRSQWNPF